MSRPRGERAAPGVSAVVWGAKLSRLVGLLSAVRVERTFDLVLWLQRTYLRRHLRTVVLAAICMAISSASVAALAWLIQPAFHEIFEARNETMVHVIPAGVLLLAAVNGFAFYGQAVLTQRVSEHVVAELQSDLYRRFMTADLAFLDSRHTGQLVAICISDCGRVLASLSKLLSALSRDISLLVLLGAVMVVRDWQLSLLTLVALPGIGVGTAVISRRVRRCADLIIDETGRLSARLTETLGGARLVKAYAMEDREIERHHATVNRRRDLILEMTRARAMSSPINEIVGGIAFALVIYFSIWRFGFADASIGDLASFLAALLLCLRPLKRLGAVIPDVQEGLVAAGRIRTLLDVQSEITDAPDAVPLPQTGPGIELRDVHFAYVPGREVIKGVSLKVPRGKVAALVGPSGAGKSTIVNLIPRLFDVQSGCVLVNGVDVRKVTQASLRRGIGFVGQDAVLFDDTVRNNIAYGCENASDDAVAAAAEAAGADQFIAKLPDGYETKVGESGVSLSGGQRQRVALARAILRDAPFLLLDEATSAVDSETELIVKKALRRLIVGRTALIVAHRLTSVVDADIIYVLVDGCIVETGNHASLLAAGGVYARLYSIQSLEEQMNTKLAV